MITLILTWILKLWLSSTLVGYGIWYTKISRYIRKIPFKYHFSVFISALLTSPIFLYVITTTKPQDIMPDSWFQQ